jgi:hypothetical protein
MNCPHCGKVILGPTGERPSGLQDKNDRGRLAVMISGSEEDGKVRINLGTDVTELNFPADEAAFFATKIMQAAVHCSGGKDPMDLLRSAEEKTETLYCSDDKDKVH